MTVDTVDTVDVALDAAADAPSAETNTFALCASAFGTAMPAGFVRTDGTVLAVLPPNEQSCAMPNSTHVIVQLTVQGAAYRLVVNVASTSGDPRVYSAHVSAPLPGPAWSEGFHTGITFDYPTTLGLHSDATAFTLVDAAQLVPELLARVAVGSRVSFFAQGSGGTSAHLVHRNGSNDDGAIVLDPEGASPTVLVFHFADQTF